ncbi:Uncharacterised protein [Serratia fonticola]|nr:Uncharacterised protein [Serratia fonticola]
MLIPVAISIRNWLFFLGFRSYLFIFGFPNATTKAPAADNAAATF